MSPFLKTVGHKKVVEKLSRRKEREQGPGLAAVLQAEKGREGLPWSWVMWRLLHPKGVLTEFMPLARLMLARPSCWKERERLVGREKREMDSLAWLGQLLTGREPRPTIAERVWPSQ